MCIVLNIQQISQQLKPWLRAHELYIIYIYVGPEFVDLDIEGKVTGWGTLYEKYKEKVLKGTEELKLKRKKGNIILHS